MPATADIRALCDQSAGDLRRALLGLTKENSHASSAIAEDLNLYADLARYYLQWSAGLLLALEDEASARLGCRAAVECFLKLTHAYFTDPARWPKGAQLEHPLTLLMPAYYAVRAAQKLNWLAQPDLVLVDLEEAHEFVIEIVGRAAADEIAQAKNADLQVLPEISEDPATVAEPRRYAAFLRAAQRRRLATARAPKPPSPPRIAVAPPPPASPPTGSSERLLALTWSTRLSDTRIVLEQTNQVLGPGSFFSRETFLELREGHRYRLVQATLTSFSSGGLHGGGPSEQESYGEWQIEVIGGIPRLGLSGDENSCYRLEKHGRGYVTLNGRDRAWTRL